MAKETKPQTYRISNEVDAELRRLGKIHGGIDKALRVVLEWQDPAIETTPVDLRKVLGSIRCPECDRTTPGHSVTCVTGNKLAMARQAPEMLGDRSSLDAIGPELNSRRGKATTETVRRGIRQKGDEKR